MTRCTKCLTIILLTLLFTSFIGCSVGKKLPENDNSGDENEECSVDNESGVTDTTNNSDLHEDESSSPDTTPKKALDGTVIVLDPGHGYYSENYKEPVSPGSSEMKNAFVTGTAGAYLSEAEFNLIVANKIKPLLIAEGAEVYFTRSDENSISNVERAVFANDLDADLAVRIHADGSSDQTVSGISVLVPAIGIIDDDIQSQSSLIGQRILNSLVSHTGANNRGVIQRSDLTGFNWSTVPVVLIECGFMSNPQEDAKLSSDAYQNLIAEGIAEAIIDYYKDV